MNESYIFFKLEIRLNIHLTMLTVFISILLYNIFIHCDILIDAYFESIHFVSFDCPCPQFL